MKATLPLDVMPMYHMQAFHMMPSGLQPAAKSEPAKVAADFCHISHQTKQIIALVYTAWATVSQTMITPLMPWLKTKWLETIPLHSCSLLKKSLLM